MALRLAARVVVILGLLAGAAAAQEFNRNLQIEVVGDTMYIGGLVDREGAIKFESLLTGNPQVTRLVSRQIEGSVDSTALYFMGYAIRQRGITTHLTAESEIYSGGVDLFIAGAERTMEEGAVIGVHSWYTDDFDGRDLPPGDSRHNPGRTFVTGMLGSDAFYWFTLDAAPGSGMHVMSPDEIAYYGLLTEPVIETGTGSGSGIADK